MHWKTRLWSIAVTGIIGFLLMSGQHIRAQANSTKRLSVLVDGSVTPGQIPDALAYHHFLVAIATHPFPTAEEQARQTAQLAPLGLSAADQQTLITGLTSFRTELDGIVNARASVGTGSGATAQLANLRTQEDTLVTSTLASIQRSLTADGVSRLDVYIKQHVKAHIKIYGGMN